MTPNPRLFGLAPEDEPAQIDAHWSPGKASTGSPLLAGGSAPIRTVLGPKHPVGQELDAKVRQLQRRLWAAAKRARKGIVHGQYLPCRSDDPQATCSANHDPAQPLPARAEPHNAACRQTTGKPCAGNAHARFDRGCWLRYRPSGLKRANIYQCCIHFHHPEAA